MKADFQRYGMEYDSDTGYPKFNLAEDDGGEYVLYEDARNLADILLKERSDLRDEIWELRNKIECLEGELIVVQSYDGRTG